MLTCTQSAGVAPEVNLRNSVQARKCASEKSTLALKPRTDITRSPKQGYQWPMKRTYMYIYIYIYIQMSRKFFLKKLYFLILNAYVNIASTALERNP